MIIAVGALGGSLRKRICRGKFFEKRSCCTICNSSFRKSLIFSGVSLQHRSDFRANGGDFKLFLFPGSTIGGVGFGFGIGRCVYAVSFG